MTPASFRIVFMGSPEPAVLPLEALAGRFDVPLVITRPDRPKGRGRKVLPTPVRARAIELGLETFVPPDVNSADVIDKIKSLKPSIIVVVSFGRILRKPVRMAATLGCVNLHFSLLPALRGAAPVPWAILNGLDRTGVSIMKLTAGVDTGPVYSSSHEPIRADDTASSLYDRLSQKGARLLVDTLEGILDGSLTPEPQDDSAATTAPKIDRGFAALDWTYPATSVDRKIRGLSGQCEAFAFLQRDKPLRVIFYGSRPASGASPGPGRASRGPAGELLVGCGDGLIEITAIQAQGRKCLSGFDFANGYHISDADTFLPGRSSSESANARP